MKFAVYFAGKYLKTPKHARGNARGKRRSLVGTLEEGSLWERAGDAKNAAREAVADKTIPVGAVLCIVRVGIAFRGHESVGSWKRTGVHGRSTWVAV